MFSYTPPMKRRQLNPLDTLPVRLMALLVCGLAALFYCYEFILRATPSVMIPELTRAYHIDASHVGILSAFYYYAYTPMQLPVGILMDRFGPRDILTGMVLLCTLGAFLFANSTQLWLAEVGQFAMGFGSAFAFVGVLKLAANWLPQRFFALASGITTTLGMLGAMFCDNFLIALVHTAGWQKTWRLAGITGVILAILIFFIVRDAPQGVRVSKTEHRDTKHAWLAFKKIMGNSQFWINGLIGGFLFLPTTVFAALWGISYLTHIYAFSAHDAGFAISLIFAGWAVGGPISGSVSSFLSNRLIPLKVGTLFSLFLILFVLFAPITTPHLTLLITLFFFGIFSSMQILCFAIGKEISPAASSGTAIAGTNFVVMLGGAFFPPVIGYLMDLHATGMQSAADGFTHADYQLGLIILPIGLLLSLVMSCFVKETHGKQRTH